MARNNSVPQKNSQQKISTRAVQGSVHSPHKKVSQKPTRKRPMFYIKEIIENVFGGLIIGSTMLIGRINCGTMANVFGVYDKLIYSIGNILKSLKYSFLLFLQIAIGIIIGILLFSQKLLDLVKNFEYPMMYLFIGAILGSLPSIYRRSKIKKFKPLYLLCMIFGTGLVYALNLLPKNQLITDPTGFRGYGMLFICGALSAAALMIPGISVSHILLVMGMYEPILMAIVNFNFLHLLFVFLGFFAGSLLMAKILDFAIRRFPTQMHFMIIGFMLASIICIFPGIPSNYYIMAGSISGFILGAVGIYLIFRHK